MGLAKYVLYEPGREFEMEKMTLKSYVQLTLLKGMTAVIEKWSGLSLIHTVFMAVRKLRETSLKRSRYRANLFFDVGVSRKI